MGTAFGEKPDMNCVRQNIYYLLNTQQRHITWYMNFPQINPKIMLGIAANIKVFQLTEKHSWFLLPTPSCDCWSMLHGVP